MTIIKLVLWDARKDEIQSYKVTTTFAIMKKKNLKQYQQYIDEEVKTFLYQFIGRIRLTYNKSIILIYVKL